MSLGLDERAIMKALNDQFMAQVQTIMNLHTTYNREYLGLMNDTGRNLEFRKHFNGDPQIMLSEDDRCGYCGHLTPWSDCHFCGGPQ